LTLRPARVYNTRSENVRVQPVQGACATRHGSGKNWQEASLTMGRRLYVGNLPYKATDEDLTQLFGSVASARVMRDMATGRARGFGFVEMVRNRPIDDRR
jgi:hypothetical protein